MRDLASSVHPFVSSTPLTSPVSPYKKSHSRLLCPSSNAHASPQMAQTNGEGHEDSEEDVWACQGKEDVEASEPQEDEKVAPEVAVRTEATTTTLK